MSISASAYGHERDDVEVDPLEAGRRPLEVAVVDGQHHGPAALRPEDPGQPVLHPPVVGGRALEEEDARSAGGTSSWNCLVSVLSASGIGIVLSGGTHWSGLAASAPAGHHIGSEEPGLGQAEDARVELAPSGRSARRRRPASAGSGSNGPLEADEPRRRPRRGRRTAPAPRPAKIAAPSAVDSLTTGTRTDTPRTSATICGQSRPLAAPPVNTISS